MPPDELPCAADPRAAPPEAARAAAPRGGREHPQPHGIPRRVAHDGAPGHRRAGGGRTGRLRAGRGPPRREPRRSSRRRSGPGARCWSDPANGPSRERAAELVKDGMVVYLDAGTTCQSMVPYLADRADLTVVTNDFFVVTSLFEHPGSRSSTPAASSTPIVGRAAASWRRRRWPRSTSTSSS